MSCRDQFFAGHFAFLSNVGDVMSAGRILRSCLFHQIAWGTVGLLFALIAQAQMTPDGSVGTIDSITGNTAEITGGTTRGTNLFHNSSEFSLTPSTINTARFNNDMGIENIITRSYQKV